MEPGCSGKPLPSVREHFYTSLQMPPAQHAFPNFAFAHAKLLYFKVFHGFGFRDNSSNTLWKTSYFSCSYGPHRHFYIKCLKPSETTGPTSRQACPTQTNSKCSAQLCGLWVKSLTTLRTVQWTDPEWEPCENDTYTASGNPPLWKKHITCVQTEVVQKPCKPSPTALSQNMSFCGSERSKCHATVLLPCLLNASSTKTSFALKEAPLTDNTNLQNAFKHRAGTEEQSLCYSNWPLWVSHFNKEII